MPWHPAVSVVPVTDTAAQTETSSPKAARRATRMDDAATPAPDPDAGGDPADIDAAQKRLADQVDVAVRTARSSGTR